jgi:hypothetical protein
MIMLVKPVPGRTVRDPHSMALLPEDGREVPDNDPFWLRRLRDGDVTTEQQARTATRSHARHETEPAHKGA